MKFNKKQIKLLMRINSQNGNKSFNELGKDIYSTYMMVYINTNKFVDMGLVEYDKKKNKIIPRLTDFGRSILRTLI